MGTDHTWAPQVRQDAGLVEPESPRAQTMGCDCERDVLLTREPVEPRLGFLQIMVTKSFGKPAVDFAEHHTGIPELFLILEQPGEADGRAKLPCLSLLFSRNRYRDT